VDWELEDVEKPFVAQLQGLGWRHIEGSLDDPAVTGRSGFAEVIQECVLREQLRALNPGQDGTRTRRSRWPGSIRPASGGGLPCRG